MDTIFDKLLCKALKKEKITLHDVISYGIMYSAMLLAFLIVAEAVGLLIMCVLDYFNVMSAVEIIDFWLLVYGAIIGFASIAGAVCVAQLLDKLLMRSKKIVIAECPAKK